MYLKVRSLLFFITISCYSTSVFAQELDKMQSELNKIAQSANVENAKKKDRVLQYTLKNKIPIAFTDSQGNHSLMIDVTDDGFPVYRSTTNAAAAITTGANKLHQGGSLGLDLTGQGVLVGVWDGGRVKEHIEFDNRIVSRDESVPNSDHATHVTGTILAKGVNPLAKGMAPKATATTWYFDNDDVAMATLAKPDESGLLISNHSYSLVKGWRFNGGVWSWLGNTAISNQEDYRFGFYSTNSQTLDQIAYNAPYYTIVWSAGNDRNDTGIGPSPPDCNLGTGYDCVGPEQSTKNTLVIGAVSKTTNYTGPSSVAMSSFSSWGPTDDGRIKPDVVGAGVSLLSSGIVGNDSYYSSSGTSMSAPNVTGSLTLLQELYKKLNGRFMKAATLKALTIHTAKECGPTDGPDFMFGWGLVDVEASAKLLLTKDNLNVFVLEDTLSNGESFELTINPIANTKITATLAWTDPAGIPVAASLDPTNLMLVNDLDMRLISNSGAEEKPWILDHLLPDNQAAHGDNFRDNVEKIEFANPINEPYTIRINHKGTLQSQHFSLIISYTSQVQSTTFYWIGDSGDWQNLAHWSMSSGGLSAGVLPDANSSVVIDENSFSSSDRNISLNGDVEIFSLNWLINKKSNLLLNNSELGIKKDIIIFSDSLTVTTPGTIRLQGDATQANKLLLNGADFSKVKIELNGAENSWHIYGDLKLDELELIQGTLKANAITIQVNKLIANSNAPKLMDLSNSTIEGAKEVLLANIALDASNAKLILENGLAIDLSRIEMSDVDWAGSIKIEDGFLDISGNATYDSVDLKGEIEISGDNVFNQFVLHEGSILNLSPDAVLTVGQQTELKGTAASPTTIQSIGTASIIYDGHYKVCYDYLNIINISLGGSAIINAGINSNLTNAPNWFSENCDDIMFPDFNIEFNCLGSLTEFENISTGLIDSHSWDFGDPNSTTNTSTSKNESHQYTSLGSFNATLTIGRNNIFQSFTKELTIVPNTLPENSILLTGGNLGSVLLGDGYQWYKDDVLLDGETFRFYKWSGEPGTYKVVTKLGSCNIVSTPFIITEIIEERKINELAIYPNPTSGRVFVKIPDEALPALIQIYNVLGKQIYSEVITIGGAELMLQQNGLYILSIQSKNGQISRTRLVVKKDP